MATHMAGMRAAGPAFQWLWQPALKNGTYGVCVFFVISGFLITRLIDGEREELFKPRFKEFYVRRVARIFPLLFLTIALGVLFTFLLPEPSKRFLYCFKTTGMKFDFLFWLSILTFSYNWFQAFFPANFPGLHWGVLWSLSVEEQFYLFYPPLLKRLGKEARLALFTGGVIGFGILWRLGVYFAGVGSAAWSMKVSFGAFDQIAFGALLYLAARKYGDLLGKQKWASGFLCLSGALILLVTYGAAGYESRVNLIYGPTFIALSSFLFLLGGLHVPFFESKYLRVLSWPGKYSYGNYLFQAVMFYCLYPVMARMEVLAAFGLFAAVTTAFSAASYHFFELPVNMKIRKMFGLKNRPLG